MFGDILLLLQFWLVNMFVGAISFPLAYFLFSRLSDRGFTISFAMGWVGISYLNFLLVSLGLLPMTLVGILVCVLFWVGFNLVIFNRVRFDLSKSDFVRFARINLVMLGLMFLWYWFRGFDAQLYQVERFMDFGILQSLFNANELPLYSMWFAGEEINYYYFGHYIGYIGLSLSFVDTVPGFYVLIVWLFGLISLLVYRFGRDVGLSMIAQDGKISTRQRLMTQVGGIISFFLVMLAGTFHGLKAIWISVIRYLAQSGYVVSADAATIPDYWYAEATRHVDGTIMEMPVYQFVIADLHPHMWGLIFGMLAIFAAWYYWNLSSPKLNLTNPYIYLVALILGCAYMTNSWDVLTLGMLLMGTIGLKHIGEIFDNAKLIWQGGADANLAVREIAWFWISYVLIAVMALGIAAPWMMNFDVPTAAGEGESLIGVVSDKAMRTNPDGTTFEYDRPGRSDIGKWLMFWGPFLFFVCAYLAYRSYSNLRHGSDSTGFVHKYAYFVIALFIFFLIFVEIFYFKDILKDGDHYRANTVFKIDSQLWLWIAALSGALIIYVVDRTRNSFLNYFFVIIVLVVFGIQSIYTYKIFDQNNTMLDQESGKILKPFRGISRGLDWWQTRYPDDYAVFLSLKNIRDKLPEHDKIRIILEAEGDSFKDNNFYSTFLGWPTPLGWYGHEWTWQGHNKLIQPRKEEVVAMYTNEDVGYTKELLDKYKIDYIIIGAIERERYGAGLKVEKLLSLGDVLIEKGDVVVIEVNKELYTK